MLTKNLISHLQRLIIASALLLTSCEAPMDDTAAPKADPAKTLPSNRQDRLMGIAIIDSDHLPFAKALKTTQSAGSQFVELVIGWDDVETAPGKFKPSPDWAKIANRLYPKNDMFVTVSFLTIDTVEDRRPEWFQSKAWDDPITIDAAWAALERTLDKLEDTTLISLSLGNEVDGFLGDAKQQAAYIRLVETLENRLDERAPDLPVGVKTSAGSLIKGDSQFVRRIAQNMDVVMLTYYPLEDNFRPRGAHVVAQDFKKFASAFSGKQIHISEIGYPSSDICGSSPADQAMFVQNAFSAWDQHKDQIKRLNWTWQVDISSKTAKVYQKYYGLENKCFGEYLGTLGLMNERAQPKPAWNALVKEANLRGFGPN